MSKRYYIEIRGLDPEKGVEQLGAAGVPADSIRVIEESESPIEHAIREVTGMTMADITGRGQSRGVVTARVIYVHLALLSGESMGKICSDIKRPRYRVRYYKADYGRKMYGDREFAIAAHKAEELLRADDRWKPATAQKPQPTTRKRKRAKHRPKTKSTPKP